MVITVFLLENYFCVCDHFFVKIDVFKSKQVNIIAHINVSIQQICLGGIGVVP